MSVELTLKELALGAEVVAVVEQLGPLLGEVVAERPDTTVEDAGIGSAEGPSLKERTGRTAKTYRPSSEM